MSGTRPNGGAWRKLCKQAKAYYSPTCHLCGYTIDTDLPATHRDSWTLDHLDPYATHGADTPTLDRVRPAHRQCNSARGSAPLNSTSPRSEDW